MLIRHLPCRAFTQEMSGALAEDKMNGVTPSGGGAPTSPNNGKSSAMQANKRHDDTSSTSHISVFLAKHEELEKEVGGPQSIRVQTSLGLPHIGRQRSILHPRRMRVDRFDLYLHVHTIGLDVADSVLFRTSIRRCGLSMVWRSKAWRSRHGRCCS